MIIDKMEKDELTYHVPVLLKESVDGMNIQPDGTYVDVTFGGAGHSREILSRLGEGGREERLANILYLYGELKNSRKLASVIVKARSGQNIRTIGEFLEIIKPLFGREREKKELAKVFQALRIEVNQEMEALKEMLLAATEALKPGGRLVVITYHSLEDRMVKNIMKTGNVEGKAETDFFGNLQTPFRLVNNKVIVPDEAEIERNPRSRSAKLRIAEKK